MSTRPYDHLLIHELMAFPRKTLDELAIKVGLSTKTISNRLKDPDFARQLQKAHRNITRQAYWQLSRSNERAITTLEELLEDENPNVRHRAAVALLSFTLKARIPADIEERVSALEASAIHQYRITQ